MTEGLPFDIWIYDLARDLRVRLTTDAGVDHNPIWSPDGSRVVFDSHRTSGSPGNLATPSTFYEKPANGATPETVLLPADPDASQSPRDWSRDGRYIVFAKMKLSAVAPTWNLWVLPVTGDKKVFPYRSGAFNEPEAALSPNGRWLAFTSSESGRNEVVIQPFPDPSGGRWQISSDGGAYPRWRRDGRELYYLDAKGRLMAVTVNADAAAFEVHESTPLFQTTLRPLQGGQGSSLFPYDATADGTRFLFSMPVGPGGVEPIGVIVNWTAMLKQ
jgi:Tol biopolymer transport system component